MFIIIFFVQMFSFGNGNPLSLACFQGNADIVAILIDNNASLEIIDKVKSFCNHNCMYSIYM